jgi:hypothetical protein
VNATTELALLGVTAAAAGGLALASDDFAFTIIFMVLSGIAFGYVLQQRGK